MQLAGAHVLVTGASRGIGERVARRAAAAGARVTAVARGEEALGRLSAETGAHALPADLADPDQRHGLLARAEEAYGPVDVLVNVAGIDGAGSTLTIEADRMAELFQVNLLAPAELCRQALPGMVARNKGHVVNVSSGFSTFVVPGLVSYSASKAGLSHLTAGLRQELQGTKVGTTLVELGPVRTAMYSDISNERLSAAALHRVKQLHIAPSVDPDEVAAQLLEAVESGKQHVVLPKRLVPMLAFTWLPRRATQILMTGLPKR
jgi:uncharacterized protein